MVSENVKEHGHCWLLHTNPQNFQSEKTDYSVKIQELQKQLALDEEEAGKIQVCMCSLKYIKYASHDAFSQIFNTPI